MRIRHVYLTDRDPQGLAEFYERALGLPVRFADPGRWVEFNLDGARLCVAGPDESTVQPGAGVVAVFEVDDVDAWSERVAAAGGTVGGTRDMGGHGRVRTITDPAGNVFQLFDRPK
ncbi:MAG: glyoxalase/bleomycin resistance/dioxygenase family protein [Streptosporangiales bacterium]|nr:glyoxalase/bleomycin resistance/dioxygenase family protein [Streptosporangiales bacterium]